MYAVAKPRGYGACPTHFVARCREAAAGGSQGYDSVGYHMASHVAGLSPDNIEDEEWDRHLDVLADHIDQGDDRAIIDWLGRFVPRCMALVPRRRRESFLAGIYRYVNEDEQDIRER
jgi:hypothetical protein